MAQHNKRRIFAAAILSALVIGTGIMLGMGHMNESIPAASADIIPEEISDPVAHFRTEREQLRAMQKAQLNDVAHDSAASAEIREMAQRQLLSLCEREEAELTLEGILQMRGWQNAVVTVHDGSANVLIPAKTVSQQESSVILDLVCRETGIMSGNVKIIPIN